MNDLTTESVQPPILQIEQVSKCFGETPVLNAIDLRAQPGEVIALLGQSGSGKSTLLRCINLLNIPEQGEIIFNQEKIELKQKKNGRRVIADPQQLQRLRCNLAMVFQQFNLWAHLTALQNITMAPIHVLHQPKQQAISDAQALLKKVNLLDKQDHYPAQLSGGQQQRIAIARALAMKPKIILFDEPTSALDPEMVGEVLHVMRQLAQEGTTMIVATHEMGFAREVASQVIFLEFGKLIAGGTPLEMFEQGKSARFQEFISAAY